MAKTLVGVEIGADSVQVVEIRPGRAPRLLRCAAEPLPDGAARDSEILNPQAVAQAVRRAWRRAKIRKRTAVLGIGSRRVLVRAHTMPVMSRELVRRALPYQVEDVLPVPASQAVLDFTPTSEQDGQQHGLLVAAVSETVEGLVDVLRAARVTPTTIDLIPFGLARVALRTSAPEETVAFVYVGTSTTYVVILSAGVPLLVRIIGADLAAASAEDELTGDLEPAAEEFATDGDLDSLNLRRRRGSSRPDPVVDELAARLRGTYSFYTARPDAPAIDRVLLSGIGASRNGVHGAVSDAFELPADVVTVEDVVRTKRRLAGDLPLMLTSTVGIALDGDRR